MNHAKKHRRGILRSAFLILATVSALFGGLAVGISAASATVFEGAYSDPTGDGSAPDRDLTSATVTYDNEAGTISATLNLAAAHGSSPVQFAAGIGILDTSGGCSYPLVVVGSVQPDGPVIWVREDTGESPSEADGDAAIDIQDGAVTLTASAPELRGLTPNCGDAFLSNPDDPDQVYDDTNSFTVAPRPTRPDLNISISGPDQIKRGGKAKVKVTIGNTGDGAASAVKVRLTAKGGGSVDPGSRKATTIAAGGSAGFAFTVKAGKRSKGSIKLKAKSPARGSKSIAATKTIKIEKPGKKPRPPGPGGKNDLVGQLFWGFEEYRYDRSSDILGLYFSNSKFVHWGIPKGGLVNCGKVTAKVDESGEMQPGCLRYSYHAKSGKLSIGKAKGSYRNGDLKLKMDSDMWRVDGKIWFPGAFAGSGTRLKATLINRTFFGLCGVSAFCTTTQELITLDPSGKFGRTASSLTTGGGGSLPFIAVGSYPPEDRGTYSILGNGRIRFEYDDGEVKTETLVIQTNKRGRPDAANEGILLDDVWFYKDDDE